MKKLILALLVFALICGFAYAFDILSYPPPIEGGNVMVDAGIGLTTNGSTYGTVSIPPIFLNIEYALPANVPISIGGFATFYRYNYRVIADSGWQYTFFTFSSRVNWHWGFDVNWLDLYSGLWIGYNVFSADWVGGGYGYSAPGYGGFDFGFQVSSHFYFTDKIGLILETGYPFALKAGVALKFGGKQGNQRSSTSSPALQRNSPSANSASFSNDNAEQMLLKLAKENKGILTVSLVALETGFSLEEAKNHLYDLVTKGFAELRIRNNGSQIYIIPDFLDEPLEGF
jgi:hypothetical protein